MGRIFPGKTVKDIEFAAETLIDPSLTGTLSKRSARFPSKLTIVEQQNELPQIDDINEKKNERK